MVTVIKKKIPKSRLKTVLKKTKRSKKKKGFDAFKHLGKMKLGEDSLKVQKRLRDEWD